MKSSGLPTESITLPKLSYDLVQDEKWLQEKGGIGLLKRIKLWSRIQATLRFEPAVFCLNPLRLSEPIQYHLILENKTTFLDLMEALPHSDFTSLIYGAGWQIIASIQQFKHQIGTTCEDRFYYFGDLDYEGLHIWHNLNEQIKTVLALPFYEALLKKSPSTGKVNQKRHEASVEAFLSQFEDAQKNVIETMLRSYGYYPQETLNKDELVAIIKSITLNVMKIQNVNEDSK